jgi:hypothetical protein
MVDNDKRGGQPWIREILSPKTSQGGVDSGNVSRSRSTSPSAYVGPPQGASSGSLHNFAAFRITRC